MTSEAAPAPRRPRWAPSTAYTAHSLTRRRLRGSSVSAAARSPACASAAAPAASMPANSVNFFVSNTLTTRPSTTARRTPRPQCMCTPARGALAAPEASPAQPARTVDALGGLERQQLRGKQLSMRIQQEQRATALRHHPVRLCRPAHTPRGPASTAISLLTGSCTFQWQC